MYGDSIAISFVNISAMTAEVFQELGAKLLHFT